MRLVFVMLAIILVSCAQNKPKEAPIVEETKELSPLEAWKKHAEERRAWQSVDGLFIGNATYFESTKHFLVPLSFKEGMGSMEAVRKLYSLKKSKPIYESPYQKRWQIVQEGRNMIQIPEFKDAAVFKVGSTDAISVTPYKMEFYESMVDANVAQSFSTDQSISDPDAQYFFINRKSSFKTAETLPILSDKNTLELRQVALDYATNASVLSEKELVDNNENFFGYITFKADTGEVRRSTVSESYFYYQLYGETQRLVMPGGFLIKNLEPTHLLVSEQPVFIAEIEVDAEYTIYRPIYLRDFGYYYCALSGFLSD